jgi:hypothetical protein
VQHIAIRGGLQRQNGERGHPAVLELYSLATESKIC